MVMESFAADFFFLPSFHFLLSRQIVSSCADLSLEQHWRKGSKPFTLPCLHSRGVDSSVYDTDTILVPWDFLGVPSPPQGCSRVSCLMLQAAWGGEEPACILCGQGEWPDPQMSSGLLCGTSP